MVSVEARRSFCRSVRPAQSATSLVEASASARVRGPCCGIARMPGNIGSTGFRGSVKPLALMMTALSKRPLVSGEADRNFVLRPPALWPNSITLSGSPPNWAILAFTHFRAWIWSRVPQLPVGCSGFSAESSGWAKKPNGPTR